MDIYGYIHVWISDLGHTVDMHMTMELMDMKVVYWTKTWLSKVIVTVV